jgi:hypothetical protein
MSYPYTQEDHDECVGVGFVIIVLVVAAAIGLAVFSIMDAPTEMDGSTAGINAHVFEEVAHEGESRD